MLRSPTSEEQKGFQLISGKWKLRRSGKKTQSIELYDLASDISESNNLAQENEALINEIIQKMNSFDEKLKNAQRPAGKL